jgi:hypothetical protein
VRSEITLALAEKKLVVPVRIKGAELPTDEELPKECKSLLASQFFVLASAEYFIDSIGHLIDSIHRTLQSHVARRQEAEDLDKFSPVSGLALGYYRRAPGAVRRFIAHRAFGVSACTPVRRHLFPR